jgi:uncharacterized surface protein with fasciclin (FAS1) repeats
MRRFFLLLILLLLGLMPLHAQNLTIADVLLQSAVAEESEFTILLLVINQANPEILETLTNPDVDITFFAPTDAAFIEMLDENQLTIADLISDETMLNALMEYQVLGEAMTASAIAQSEQLSPILLDSTIRVSVLRDVIRLNGTTRVLVENVIASNGIIHVVDHVLMPEIIPNAEVTPEATAEN